MLKVVCLRLAIVLLVILLSTNPTNAGTDQYTINFIVPTLLIDTYWNNITENSLSVSINPGDIVEFGVTTNLLANNISWYNGSTFLENDTATSQGNLTHQFNNEGTFYINVSAVDDDDTTANTTFTVLVGYEVPAVVTYSPSTPHRSDNGTNVTFNVTFSQSGNTSWHVDGILIEYDNLTSAASYTNSSSVIGGPYNVTASFTNTNGTVSQIWEWTVTSPIDNKIPLSLFIMWSVVMFASAVIGFMATGMYGITASLLTATIAYMNSKNIINGNVVQYFSGISTSDTIVTGSRSIESLPMSYIYLFIAIVMVIVFILQVINEVKYNLEPDMDGEFFDE